MNEYLKLIVENDFSDFDFITETDAKTGIKYLRLRGTYLIANKKNGNNRIYPLDDMRKEVDRFVEEMVSTNRALGELEHPEYSHINPKESAVRVVSLVEDKQEEGVWIGESIVLSSDPEHNIKGTPNGDILASLIQHETRLGFSSRGVGKMVDEKWNGKKESIVRNYRMSAIDCVVNPSIRAFVDGILESKRFMIDTHGDIVEIQYEKLENGLASIPVNGRSDYMHKLIKTFMGKI